MHQWQCRQICNKSVVGGLFHCLCVLVCMLLFLQSFVLWYSVFRMTVTCHWNCSFWVIGHGSLVVVYICKLDFFLNLHIPVILFWQFDSITVSWHSQIGLYLKTKPLRVSWFWLTCKWLNENFCVHVVIVKWPFTVVVCRAFLSYANSDCYGMHAGIARRYIAFLSYNGPSLSFPLSTEATLHIVAKICASTVNAFSCWHQRPPL